MIDTERGNREVADQTAGYGSYITGQRKEYLRDCNNEKEKQTKLS